MKRASGAASGAVVYSLFIKLLELSFPPGFLERQGRVLFSWDLLIQGFADALGGSNLLWALAGCLLGTLIGVLPEAKGAASAAFRRLPRRLILASRSAAASELGSRCPSVRRGSSLPVPAPRRRNREAPLTHEEMWYLRRSWVPPRLPGAARRESPPA